MRDQITAGTAPLSNAGIVRSGGSEGKAVEDSTAFSAVPIAVAIIGLTITLVVLWARHRARRRQMRPQREPTQAERERLRRQGRLSILGFVSFWFVAGGLMLAGYLLPLSETVQRAFYALVLVMAFGGVALQLGIRCPICRYRLGLQQTLGVPTQCERCGVRL